MARIQHIAIFSDDPHRLAGFYGEVFGTSLTGVNNTGANWVSDGYMDIALLRRRGENPPKAGINHWGFTIDPAEKPAIIEKMKSFGVEVFSPYSSSPEGFRPYAEDAVKDPDGNRFDLSTGMREVKGGEIGTAPRAGADSPKIKHIAIFSDDPAKLSRFYVECFGFRITGQSQGDVWVTDGYVDVALILRRNVKAPRGIHHWGWTLTTEQKPAIYAALRAKGLPPTDPRVEDPTIDRPYVEDKGNDVDGNRYDLTTAKRDMDVEKARTARRLGALTPAK